MEAEILQRLYDSEINWQINSFWDNGIACGLGDKPKGYTASFAAKNVKKAIYKLAALALIQYPDSEFAKWWREQNK